MGFIAIFVGYPLLIFVATVISAKLLKRGLRRVASSLLILPITPIAIAAITFPPGAGGGGGVVILVPLLWILGFASVTAGNLLGHREVK